MALPAGRRGVRPDQLNPDGSIKSNGGSYELPVASADTLGGVKVGSGLSIADGVLSNGYELPVASADALGGVKVGSGLSIADGVLSNGYELPVASADTLGGVKVGSGLSITDGVLSAGGGSGTKMLLTLIDNTARDGDEFEVSVSDMSQYDGFMVNVAYDSTVSVLASSIIMASVKTGSVQSAYATFVDAGISDWSLFCRKLKLDYANNKITVYATRKITIASSAVTVTSGVTASAYVKGIYGIKLG